MSLTGSEHDERDEMAILKQFWNRYGKIIIGALIAFVIISVFVNFWYKRRMNASAAASQIFQEMVYADMHQDNENAIAKGVQLMQEYKNTPYAQFAGLLLAKDAVANGDLDKAVEQLNWVIDHKGSHDMAGHLATVRLAAVLQQQGKLDEALKLVEKDPDPAYTSLYAQARGDILVAKGELDPAKTSYKIALQSLPVGVKSPLLQMKLADLGSENEA